MKHLRPASVLLLAMVAMACDNPTGPTSSLVGTWQGTFTSTSFQGSGTAQVTFAQNGGSLTGTWSANDPTGPSSGTVTGSSNASSASFTLQPSDPLYCAMSVTATFSAAQISGTWATVSCTGSASGGLTLTKQ